MGWNGTGGMEKLPKETNGVLKRKIRKAGFEEHQGDFCRGCGSKKRKELGSSIGGSLDVLEIFPLRLMDS
jgi:hypothetical protein